jgi:hypothetical protein
MPTNFEWIFKRDPHAAERERKRGGPASARGTIAKSRAQSERCETTLTSVPLGSRTMKRRTPHSSSRSE